MASSECSEGQCATAQAGRDLVLQLNQQLAGATPHALLLTAGIHGKSRLALALAGCCCARGPSAGLNCGEQAPASSVRAVINRRLPVA